MRRGTVPLDNRTQQSLMRLEAMAKLMDGRIRYSGDPPSGVDLMGSDVSSLYTASDSQCFGMPFPPAANEIPSLSRGHRAQRHIDLVDKSTRLERQARLDVKVGGNRSFQQCRTETSA